MLTAAGKSSAYPVPGTIDGHKIFVEILPTDSESRMKELVSHISSILVRGATALPGMKVNEIGILPIGPMQIQKE